ncbi:cupredoxin domain-containing protein [Methanobacterium sp.]|uniref:cupredoxin domain-containing protein n=1 Tax=Methanobacterium sp. TaxID=2164 RepID=UPI003C773ADE
MYRRTSRGLLALIIIIIIIIVAGVYLYYAQSSNPNIQTVINNSTNQSLANNTSIGNNSTNVTSATTISIQNMTFNPNKITIGSGTNIQWINNDNAQHQIVSDTGAFQSNILNPGDSYNFFFAKTGIYGYHDALNPTITGTIIVQ